LGELLLLLLFLLLLLLLWPPLQLPLVRGQSCWSSCC
jgi:hypothetical protein